VAFRVLVAVAHGRLAQKQATRKVLALGRIGSWCAATTAWPTLPLASSGDAFDLWCMTRAGDPFPLAVCIGSHANDTATSNHNNDVNNAMCMPRLVSNVHWPSTAAISTSLSASGIASSSSVFASCSKVTVTCPSRIAQAPRAHAPRVAAIKPHGMLCRKNTSMHVCAPERLRNVCITRLGGLWQTALVVGMQLHGIQPRAGGCCVKRVCGLVSCLQDLGVIATKEQNLLMSSDAKGECTQRWQRKVPIQYSWCTLSREAGGTAQNLGGGIRPPLHATDYVAYTKLRQIRAESYIVRLLIMSLNSEYLYMLPPSSFTLILTLQRPHPTK